LSYGTEEQEEAFYVELMKLLTPNRRARIEVEIARMFGERKRREEIHERALTIKDRDEE
jgi:hypothetical protein